MEKLKTTISLSIPGKKNSIIPPGEQNVFESYQGKGGIPVGGFLRKALWSARFGALKILLSSDINAQSRILFDRSIRTRVQKLVPFLQVDEDPYLVVSGGRLYWILDAYALSNNYPYSRPVKKMGNYIRNSVVAVVDAYEGSVQLYIKDEKDPLAQAYSRIFPDLLQTAGGHGSGPENPFALSSFFV